MTSLLTGLENEGTYQHGCTQVVFVKELSDENVHLQDVGHILPLDIPKDIHEPLETSMRWCDPDKVDLGNDIGIKYKNQFNEIKQTTFLQATSVNRFVEVPKTRSFRIEA